MFHTTNKKQLILVRHADAVDASKFEGSDFDRSLSSKGQQQALIVARYLRLTGIRPDLLLSSSALRTRETADIIAEQMGVLSVELLDDLYYGHSTKKRNGNQSYLRAIQSVSRDIDVLLLVGHNDEITEFAGYISREEIPSMKKGSVAIFSLPSKMNWKDMVAGELSLLYYLTPQFLNLESLS